MFHIMLLASSLLRMTFLQRKRGHSSMMLNLASNTSAFNINVYYAKSNICMIQDLIKR